MVRKRAHTLRYNEVISTGGYRDEYGDWVEGDVTEKEIVLSCRADVNTAGRTVPNNEGQDFVYNYAIYLDTIPDSLKRNVEIEILKAGKVILSGKVIMPFEFQEHCTIWV